MFPMKALVVLYSYHHNNTKKIAEVFARVLDAKINTPQQINPEALMKYNLVGFGSGIYGEKHHKSLFDLVDKLPQVTNKKAFIFSTSSNVLGVSSKTTIAEAHLSLREKLQSKGYVMLMNLIVKVSTQIVSADFGEE